MNPRINSNRESPTDQDLDADAGAILERFREARILRPIARVRAWEGMAAVQGITAEDVWSAWRRFKAAQDAAKAGGTTGGLLDLHDEFTRLLGLWLNGPAA